MKPSPQENADLTAYALGELHARQAREVHDLLSASPTAQHELEQIEAVTDALRQGAPIPQERLRPEQRHAVLYPANMPRRMGPMMPRPMPRRGPALWPVVRSVMKTAAVVALAGVAFYAGRHGGESPPALAAADSAPQDTASILLAAERANPSDLAALPHLIEKKALPTNLEPEVEDRTLPEKAPVVVIVDSVAPAVIPPQAPPAAAKAKPAATVQVAAVPDRPLPGGNPRPLPVTTPGKHTAFVSASRHPVDQFGLKPAQVRPPLPKPAQGSLLAAPLPAGSLSLPEAKDSTRARTPDLYIHSWKAEVVTCPWSAERRLLRVSVQLPADQPAAMTPSAYPLRVTFDANNVREYRQLCERHQPAAELRQAGTHLIWYEYLPNGSAEVGKTIATVTLDKSRFTTQTVGPFDSSKLEVQDRGLAWQRAREDFVFDSAVIGFGMLMRGLPDAPALDYDLVLALAEKAKGKDTDGERTRFIRLVRQAAGAAGL